MANRMRGEVTLTIEGTSYTLRHDMEAIIQAEDRAGLGVMGMSVRFTEKRYGAREIAALIWSGFLGAQRAGINQKYFSYEEILAVMSRVGVIPFHQAALDLCVLTLRGAGVSGEDLSQGKSEPKMEVPTPT